VQNKEKYLVGYVRGACEPAIRTHRNHPWVVGRVNPLETSSVVMTLVEVMQKDSNWPAYRDRSGTSLGLQYVLKTHQDGPNETRCPQTLEAPGRPFSTA
jgi:hypothetical protein